MKGRVSSLEVEVPLRMPSNARRPSQQSSRRRDSQCHRLESRDLMPTEDVRLLLIEGPAVLVLEHHRAVPCQRLHGACQEAPHAGGRRHPEGKEIQGSLQGQGGWGG